MKCFLPIIFLFLSLNLSGASETKACTELNLVDVSLLLNRHSGKGWAQVETKINSLDLSKREQALIFHHFFCNLICFSKGEDDKNFIKKLYSNLLDLAMAKGFTLDNKQLTGGTLLMFAMNEKNSLATKVLLEKGATPPSKKFREGQGFR